MYADPKLYGLETMTLAQQIDHLAELCRQERARGLAGHWTYELARHRGYFAMLKDAMARRDIEAIDKAFERAGQRILEAAE
jgi:hypothetical protein